MRVISEAPRISAHNGHYPGSHRVMWAAGIAEPWFAMRMKDMRAHQVSNETSDYNVGGIVQAASVAGRGNGGGRAVGQQFDPWPRILMCYDPGHSPLDQRMAGGER